MSRQNPKNKLSYTRIVYFYLSDCAQSSLQTFREPEFKSRRCYQPIHVKHCMLVCLAAKYFMLHRDFQFFFCFEKLAYFLKIGKNLIFYESRANFAFWTIGEHTWSFYEWHLCTNVFLSTCRTFGIQVCADGLYFVTQTFFFIHSSFD